MPTIKKTVIDEKYLWIGGGIIVVIIIVFVWGRLSGKGAVKDNSDVNPNINPINVNTSTGSFSWDPSQLVKEIYQAYNVDWGWGSSRCVALDKISNLQDPQIIALADGYFQTYKKTLRKTITDTWSDGCWSDLTYLAVIKRLDTLQIV